MTKDSKNKSLKEWKESLTPEQFKVCWLKQTEPPFSGEYNECWEEGTFHCVCCQHPLFTSASKFNSSSGWPSFFQPLAEDSLDYERDNSLAMERIEVLCGSCGAHLGHVFNDGPQPTGKRFCINSVALRFEASK